MPNQNGTVIAFANDIPRYLIQFGTAFAYFLIQFGNAIAVPRLLNAMACNKRAILNYVVGEAVSLS